MFFYFVLSCTDVSLLFSPIVWLSAGGKLKVMAYLIEKAASAYVTEKADGLTLLRIGRMVMSFHGLVEE